MHSTIQDVHNIPVGLVSSSGPGPADEAGESFEDITISSEWIAATSGKSDSTRAYDRKVDQEKGDIGREIESLFDGTQMRNCI